MKNIIFFIMYSHLRFGSSSRKCLQIPILHVVCWVKCQCRTWSYSTTTEQLPPGAKTKHNLCKWSQWDKNILAFAKKLFGKTHSERRRWSVIFHWRNALKKQRGTTQCQYWRFLQVWQTSIQSRTEKATKEHTMTRRRKVSTTNSLPTGSDE